MTNNDWSWLTPFLSFIGLLFLLSLPTIIKIARNYPYLVFLKTFMNRRKNDLLVISNITLDESLIAKVNNFAVKANTKEVDIILNTPGGDIFSTMAIIDILKNMKKHLNVFVPYYSMSGGTMLAMACDKIFMTPIASLGCVDPQVGIWYKGAFSKASLDYVIQNKKKLASDDTFALKFIASQYEKSIRGLVKKIRPDLPDKTINLMTSGKLEHGFRITPAVARDLGINAETITDKIMLKLLYKIHRISGVKTKYFKVK